jgi:hypothetical protein
MFPGLTQKHIKLKFRAEEAKNSKKITEYLRTPKKAPPELRTRILQSVPAKQRLEDSRYVHKRPNESKEEDVKLPSASSDHLKVELTGDVQLETITEEVVEAQVTENLVTPVENIPEKEIPPVELPDLIPSKPVKGPIAKSRRRKRVTTSFDAQPPVVEQELGIV